MLENLACIPHHYTSRHPGQVFSLFLGKPASKWVLGSKSSVMQLTEISSPGEIGCSGGWALWHYPTDVPVLSRCHPQIFPTWFWQSYCLSSTGGQGATLLLILWQIIVACSHYTQPLIPASLILVCLCGSRIAISVLGNS